jgi:signal transduction histidine kinase
MFDFRHSIAARLVLAYGLLVAISVAAVSAVFYFGTIGVLQQNIDAKIVEISQREILAYGDQPIPLLAQEITRQLNDSIDSDTEIFLLLSPSGQRIAGNLDGWPTLVAGRLLTRQVTRNGKVVLARVYARWLDNHSLLIVGRDLDEEVLMGQLVARALGIGALIAFLLIAAGAVLLRQQIERRIGEIRHTVMEIEAGDLTQRIPVSGTDEFGRLNTDINRMLDRIEQLMEGVRHVSNAIAHDLRTPLSRIRTRLEAAVRAEMNVEGFSFAANAAIQDIDDLMLVFEKLLQIAEAESGVRSTTFESVDLDRIARDMVELYDAEAEARGVALRIFPVQSHAVPGLGDRNLLANALASLIDNAIKYNRPGGWVEVRAMSTGRELRLEVRDSGAGIPQAELPKVTTRFYRVDQSRNLPGNGLGLSIVSAIASLHGGQLALSNTEDGFMAVIVLPV